MKNLKADPEDTLRPEYKRSDFGEIIPGKYATTQVEFHQLIDLLLSCIGEDEGVKFIHHSVGNRFAQHKLGDWSYEIDNANQITLRYWQNEFSSIEESVTNPSVVTNAVDRTELHEAILNGFKDLKTKVAAAQDWQ